MRVHGQQWNQEIADIDMDMCPPDYRHREIERVLYQGWEDLVKSCPVRREVPLGQVVPIARTIEFHDMPFIESYRDPVPDRSWDEIVAQRIADIAAMTGVPAKPEPKVEKVEPLIKPVPGQPIPRRLTP